MAGPLPGMDKKLQDQLGPLSFNNTQKFGSLVGKRHFIGIDPLTSTGKVMDSLPKGGFCKRQPK